MFKEISTQFDFPDREHEVSAYWEKHNIFHESLKRREGEPEFVFYEGPPTANGLPGIHHAMARVVKDTICRYKTMKGFRVERKAGWDTQGLPVELEVEKRLGFSIKEKIAEYGIEKFNNECRESVFRYKTEWDDFTRNIGFWLDLENAYVTYTNEYIESVWWALASFHRKGFLYKGYKILPWCPRCGTALSSHEVAQGYDTVEDPSVFVKMELIGRPGVYFLVWTTTPWTLISNVALAVHPEIKYVELEVDGAKYILENNRAQLIFGGEAKLVREYKGSELEGTPYKPLFTFIKPDKKAHYVAAADFVTTEEGTGIVHIAPAFGADDYNLSLKYDLPIIQAVDDRGKFIPDVSKWAGQFVKEADPDITKDLEERGLLFKEERYSHTYPFCWRCDSPLLYYARSSWFIRTTGFKDEMIKNNKEINWQPPEIRDGRFGEWLENNIDWALSRERYWGTPLPVWVCEKCGSEQSAGSIEDLKKYGRDVPDDIELHKPYVDRIKFECPDCGGEMTRTPEVIDAWFDSGSMPFAQYHYPFENKEKFESRFPADFIAEGIDQTRGWFYSLLAISTFLFGKSSYKNILVNELILDKEGQKMSKSRGNVVDPRLILKEMGADALRWYLMSVSQVWLPTKFDPDGVMEVAKKFLSTLKNSYMFFALYANIDNFNPANVSREDLAPAPIDKWLESRLSTLVKEADKSYREYEITRACRQIQHFVIEDLSNWYIRRCRRRYWGSEQSTDKTTAYFYLWDALLTVCKLAAPVAPFLSEEIYLYLVEPLGDGEKLSVHLDRFPEVDESLIDSDLEYRMGRVMDVVSLGLAARKKSKLKVRQPLSQLLVNLPGKTDPEKYESILSHIKDELNIKEVKFVENLDALSCFEVKPVFKNLGPKFGKKANPVANALKELSAEEAGRFKTEGNIELDVDGEKHIVGAEDVEFVSTYSSDYEVAEEGETAVALKTVITDDLRDEGFAREAINKIQNMRKSAGFNVTDTIETRVGGSEKLCNAIEKHKEYISRETLSGSIFPVAVNPGEELEDDKSNGDFRQKWNLNGEETIISIKKTSS
ncbi:MAG: isoleucine--tRNA ligase [candidate division Zixibacteria bacterium]|nr:isoleucine--tRNA ligase [candidate division Zixibacteria bacterium]